MNYPLLSLGLFIFATGYTAIDEIERKSSYRYGTGNAVGVRPKLQYIGEDNDQINMNGLLYPPLTDGVESLQLLRNMAKSGQSYALIGGDGTYYGLCKIDSIDEKRNHLMYDGTARKIEFSLALKLQDDQQNEEIAILQTDLLELLNLDQGLQP